jgi:hypothetical protein
MVFCIGNCNKTCDDADVKRLDDSDEYDSSTMVDYVDCDGNDDSALNTKGTDYDSVSDDEASECSGEGTVKSLSKRSAGQSGDDRGDGINEYDSEKDDDDGERNDDSDDDDDCDGNDDSAFNTKGTDYDSVSDDEASECSGEGTVKSLSKRSAGRSVDDRDGNNDTADIGVDTSGPVIRTAYCK